MRSTLASARDAFRDAPEPVRALVGLNALVFMLWRLLPQRVMFEHFTLSLENTKKALDALQIKTIFSLLEDVTINVGAAGGVKTKLLFLSNQQASDLTLKVCVHAPLSWPLSHS